jgi:hypothetical protein
MFVFGEVQDPNPETVNLVEDIVRSQIIELVRLQFSRARTVVSCELDYPSKNVGEQTRSTLRLGRRPHLPNTPRSRQS